MRVHECVYDCVGGYVCGCVFVCVGGEGGLGEYMQPHTACEATA